MKIVFKIASLETMEIIVKGDYGSDYQDFGEYCTVIHEFAEEFNDEESAIAELPNYFCYGNELTILKIYQK